MKRIIKLRTLIVLSLIIIMFSGCENILPPNDISGDNTDIECPQAGYIYRGSSYNPIWVNGFGKGEGDQYLFDDFMQLNAHTTRATAEKSYVIDKPIDLTCINSIVIDWENIGFEGENNKSYLVVSASSKYGRYDNNDQKLEFIKTFKRRIDTLDVSALKGNYYIRVHALEDGWNGQCKINVYSIELIQ